MGGDYGWKNTSLILLKFSQKKSVNEITVLKFILVIFCILRMVWVWAFFFENSIN